MTRPPKISITALMAIVAFSAAFFSGARSLSPRWASVMVRVTVVVLYSFEYLRDTSHSPLLSRALGWLVAFAALGWLFAARVGASSRDEPANAAH